MRHAPPSYGPFAGKGRAPAALKGAALRAASLHPRLFIPPDLICLSGYFGPYPVSLFLSVVFHP
ncbi:hypothetical protein AAFR86_01160 (plasmid) [Salmonella enterica subsp. diarizonae serovar 58:r:z53]